MQRIESVYTHSRKTYGSPRVHAQLRAEGERISRKRVVRLMRQQGLSAQVKRHKVRTTDSSHGLPIASNVLGQRFTETTPGRVWVTDITYVSTAEGWLYLAAVMDLWSRRILGWSMQPTLETTLVLEAFKTACQRQRPPPGMVHHSDRGCQYASRLYQRQLRDRGIVCSMSRKGNCLDNAVAESFFPH